jgi:hypothetical protein
MLLALVLLAGLAAVSAQHDVSGSWMDEPGGCVVPPSTNVTQCGTTVLLVPTNEDGTMDGDAIRATIDDMDHLTWACKISNVDAQCIGNVTLIRGQINAYCTVSGSSAGCKLDQACMSGACKGFNPAPVPGPAGSVDLSGTWGISESSNCGKVPGFATAFEVEQCDETLLVFPEGDMGPNVGTVDEAGSFTIGNTPGSTISCKGTVVTPRQAISGSCFFNGQPLCTFDATLK